MIKLRTAILAGVGTLLFAGAAVAATAKFHTMSVDLPDGSVAHITYAGDVAPKVAIDAANAQDQQDGPDDAVANDPFAAMDQDFARVSAMMAHQQQQMTQQVAAMQHQGAGQPGQVVITGNMPAGSSYSYTMVSSSNGKASCSQSVEYRSNGDGKAPMVTRASSGDCGAVKGGEGDKPVPVSAPQQPAPVDPRSI
jgi:hypothetical protein